MNKAATNKEVRANNQKSIINTLFRHGPMTSQELADFLNLSLPTVSVINKNLAAKGLITRGDKLESSGGRPASNIQLVADAKLSIGVDIATDNVRIVLVNLGPQVVLSETYPLSFGHSGEYWSALDEVLETFITSNHVDRDKLIGIGLSIQAHLNMEPLSQTSSLSIHLTDFDLEKIREIFGEGTRIYNPAKMACLGQVWGFGEENDSVYLTLSGNVGGAIIVDRRILGEDTRNAEFGHMVLNENGPLCACGQRGCLESYCSSRALQKRSGTNLKAFFAALDDGNAGYREIWSEYIHYLALAIINIRFIFDTDIIIGGEMSMFIGAHLQELRGEINRRDPFGGNGDYVRIGSYGEYDSAIGAAMIHIDAFLS